MMDSTLNQIVIGLLKISVVTYLQKKEIISQHKHKTYLASLPLFTSELLFFMFPNEALLMRTNFSKNIPRALLLDFG